MNNKQTRGGTRSNAGAKPKYNEKTTTIAFRVPMSKVDDIKALVADRLKLIKAGMLSVESCDPQQ